MQQHIYCFSELPLRLKLSARPQGKEHFCKKEKKKLSAIKAHKSPVQELTCVQHPIHVCDEYISILSDVEIATAWYLTSE